jgi:hypothetical protein
MYGWYVRIAGVYYQAHSSGMKGSSVPQQKVIDVTHTSERSQKSGATYAAFASAGDAVFTTEES